MDYPYIVAWHRMTGSYQAYIKRQVEKARTENAPYDAIYKGPSTGEWHTVKEIQNEKTRAYIEEQVLKLTEAEHD